MVNALLIDTINYRIERELNCDFVLKQGMYYKIGKELMPAAMIYPIEKREVLQKLLDEVKAARKVFEDIQTRVFYKDLPALKQ